MKKYWSTARERRDERIRQLNRLSDKALMTQIQMAQKAEWRATKLTEHLSKHKRDYVSYFRRAVTEQDIVETSHLVMHTWDRLFTSIESDGTVSYTFSSEWEPSRGRVFVVVTRGQWIRTLIPSSDYSRYLGRHVELIEVTDRVRKTGSLS